MHTLAGLLAACILASDGDRELCGESLLDCEENIAESVLLIESIAWPPGLHRPGALNHHLSLCFDSEYPWRI